MAVVPDVQRATAPVIVAARRRFRADPLALAVVGAGTGLAMLVGWDGSPVWRVARVVGVAVATAVGWYLAATAHRATRGVAAFAIGLAATAAGAGVGGPHLAKTGWSALAIVGLVTLAAGAVLLVGGGVAVVRATRRWWRVPVIPVLLLAAYAGLWSLGQAVAATNVPRTDVGAVTPADRGLDFADVTFPASDGVRLSGWYLPSTTGAAVVLLHGAGSTRSAVLAHAGVLARNGYGVLLFDARGHGRSTGRAMDFGWYGDRDISGAVTFLQHRAGVDGARIAAVGVSMGGEEAIGAAATDRRIRAVVAEGATNRVAADKAFLTEAYGWRGTVQRGVDWLTSGAADLLTAAGRPIPLRAAAAAATPRPVLLITAGDVPDEGLAARFISAGAPGNVRIWEVPDTGHGQALATHPQEWERQVTAALAGV